MCIKPKEHGGILVWKCFQNDFGKPWWRLSFDSNHHWIVRHKFEENTKVFANSQVCVNLWKYDVFSYKTIFFHDKLYPK